ncbi:hypothetical protein [Pseudothauera lacus]|nr:hypothetical protein [Pseudothauera lacus]
MRRSVRVLLRLALVLVALAVLGALFVAYQQPELLIDFTNLVFCG